MSGTRVAVPGPKIILTGVPGDGKTHSIRTILAAGLKCFVVFADPGMEVLLDPARGKVYTCGEGLHYNYIPPVSVDWKELADAAELLNKFTFEQLAKMPPMGREKFRGWYDFITLMGNLKCIRCGQVFGPADQLQPYNEWCIVNDGLTGISIMAMNILIGTKPAIHQGEYGVAMMNLERYINKFAVDLPSMGVLMCHVEREGDEVTGGQVNMVATLGRKLAPKIPRFFSDMLLTIREGDKFKWSNITPNFSLKNRNFPFSSNLSPDFGPAIKAWQAKIAQVELQQGITSGTTGAASVHNLPLPKGL